MTGHEGLARCGAPDRAPAFVLADRTLTLTGDIDTVAVDGWRADDRDLPRLETIDARGVTFLDARGLGLLLQLARVADPARITLRVHGPHVTRVLDLTHLAWFFDVDAGMPPVPGLGAPA